MLLFFLYMNHIVSPKFNIRYSHFLFIFSYKTIMFLLVLFFLIILNQNKQLNPVSATEFVYNRNFNSTNINLYGNATIQKSILTLTNQTSFTIGRAFYPYSVPMKKPNSSPLLPFATSFIFSISPCKNLPTGHGFAFIFSPSKVINGALSGNYLGLFNRSSSGNSSNHVLAIEFDDFRNEEFNEENDNHVGVDLNSIISLSSEPAEFWNGEEFEKLRLASGENFQVWIEFRDSEINVTMAPAGRRKPQRPLISKPIELSRVLLDEMYVGFSGATGGRMVEVSRVLAWSFSHSNFSIGDALNTKHLPMFVQQKKSIYRSNGFILGAIFGSLFVVFGCCTLVYFILFRTRKEEKEEIFEDWELEYWPHRISYKEICDATSGFSEEKVIGIGTSGKVYKGILNGVEVAVKRFNFNRDTQHGMREFIAEISSLGRVKHRNLVGFKGWSKRKDGKLILVYDYMENRSLDKRIFECEEETKVLNWDERIRILQNVACGILYLHEGWEVEVLHRDIKASNVLLDKYMNARLGDFGLARLQHKEQVCDTTRVIGTLGYMAPELIKIGRPSSASDVYSFGILVLEVVCGRRPIEVNKPPLVDFVISLMEKGELCCAIDERLKGLKGSSNEEGERLLHLGLMCASLEPCVRPTMRQVVKALEGIKCNECNVEECIFHEGLIGKISSAASWSKGSSTNSTHVNFPTLDEIYPSKFFSSASLSVSCPSLQSELDSLSEGR